MSIGVTLFGTSKGVGDPLGGNNTGKKNDLGSNYALEDCYQSSGASQCCIAVMAVGVLLTLACLALTVFCGLNALLGLAGLAMLTIGALCLVMCRYLDLQEQRGNAPAKQPVGYDNTTPKANKKQYSALPD